MMGSEEVKRILDINCFMVCLNKSINIRGITMQQIGHGHFSCLPDVIEVTVAWIFLEHSLWLYSVLTTKQVLIALPHLDFE